LTGRLLEGDDDDLLDSLPLIGRRVDYFQRRYNRNWEEVIGVVLWGQPHITIDEQELRFLQAIDGRRTLREILLASEAGSSAMGCLPWLRRLSACGIVDLVEPAERWGQGAGIDWRSGRIADQNCSLI
jgi:hypothetical protein